MNFKIASVLSAALVSAVFAQEAAPAAPAPEAAPVAAPATENAPAAEQAAQEQPAQEQAAAPAAEAAPAETAAPVAEAPVAEPAAEPVAEPVAAPAEEPADVAVAPKAVRGGERVPVEPVVEPAAPAETKSAEPTRKAVYYETVYTNEEGRPVRTLYVAEHSGKDTVTMDELMGLRPMKFKIGASGSVGSYVLSGNDWDSDSFSGMNWRAGISAIIPLNEYTMGLRLGVFYDHSEASESYYYNDIATNFSFENNKIDIPVLFTFKSAASRFYFDLGAELSVPVKDNMKISYTDSKGTKHKSKTDMMDEDFRKSLDWGFIFGFSIMANDYISLDIRADVGLSDLYSSYEKLDLGLSNSSFNVGISVYPF